MKEIMEENRLWHEPVVEIYANAISPGASCSAQAYDLANRRWYQLNVRNKAWSSDGNGSLHEDSGRSAMRPFQVPEDEWLSSTVAKHISDCYKATGSPPSWNIINTTTVGYPVTFEQAKNNYRIGMPIFERFFYGHKSSDQLPIIAFRALNNKMYLSRGADYCDWEGRKCVFKRIEFDCDNQSHENEIRAREHLIQQITQDSNTITLDIHNEMMTRFNVVPILGVVLHDETSLWMVQTRPRDEDEDEDEDEEECEEEGGEEGLGEAIQNSHTVAGFITPYIGRSLELLGAAHPSGGVESNTNQLPSVLVLGSLSITAEVPIMVEQLLDLVKGVRELSRSGITHGDICYWNIVLEESGPQSTPSTMPRLLLIDMGDTAPDYVNDAVALAGVLLWCLKHSPHLREDIDLRKKVIIASALLKEVNFDGAIEVMSPGLVSKAGFKTEALQYRDGQRVKRRRL
jgi:hypothetical protein